MISKTKSLGQNFLIDDKIANREVDYCNISMEDTVLEIGSGKGILTKKLVKKAKLVISVELDKNLYEYCKKEITNKNLILINDDALLLNFNNIPKFNKIVSNLPYKISAPITFKLLDFDFERAILIYQKEFAKRMVAKEGENNYSRLSVLIYYKSFCKIIENISKKSFKPIPKVDSSIIELIPRKTPPFNIIDEKFFFDFTKNLFNYKRKKIKNNLSKFYEVNVNKIPYINNRIDELSPEEIGDLSNIVFKNIN